MILGAHHGHDGLAISEGKQGSLLAKHTFLDHHSGTGRAEAPVFHDVIHGRQCLIHSLGNHHALACREAVRLDDDRCALGFYIVTGRSCIRKNLVFSRGDTVLLHDVLGKGLGAFQLRRRPGRAESADARPVHGIHQTIGQWYLRAYDHKLNALFPSKGHQSIIVLNGNAVFAFRDFRHAGIARYSVDFFRLGALSELPGQGMLTAAAADY